jgi:outer membrane protein insertion porin family
LKASKFIRTNTRRLDKVIATYKEKGYRDTRLFFQIQLFNKEKIHKYKDNVEEGNKYYFGDIKFLEIQFTLIRLNIG